MDYCAGVWAVNAGLCAFVRIYVLLLRSMDLRAVLWTVIAVYGPSCSSMDRYCGLWAIARVYVPLLRSMGLRMNPWTVIAVYGPSHESMDRRTCSMDPPPDFMSRPPLTCLPYNPNQLVR